MFSVISRLIFLLFTLLHIKSVRSSINGHTGGYVYQTPTIKSVQITNLPVTPSSSAALNHIESQLTKLSAFNLNHYSIPTLSDNFLTDTDDTYIADGRILKQYEVMEDIPGDYIPDDLINRAPLLLSSLLAKYNRLSPSLIPQQQSASFIIQPVTRNHGPVALGSGALGYIRLPNGGIYLGSGSLGYISGAERVREINDSRMRRIIQPSPLVFGTTHLN